MKYFKNTNEITKLAADDILAYMLEGFTLCMTELKGSYGFEGKQEVLERGNERVVIWMERERCEFDRWEDDYVLRIAHITLAEGESMEFHYEWPRKWAEHVVKEWRAYNLNGLSHRNKGVWTTDRAEAEAANKKRDQRHERKHVSSLKALDTANPKVMAIIRRLDGFKTAKASDVTITYLFDDNDGASFEVRRFRNGRVSQQVRIHTYGKHYC